MRFAYRHLLKSDWIERRILLAVLTVVRRPRITLLCAAVLLAASCLSAMRWLNVSSDQDKLFSPKVKFFRDYIEFDRQFPENDAIYIVIEQKEPDAPLPHVKRWTAAADAVVASLQKVPAKYVDSIDAHIPLDKLGRQSLLFEPLKSLQADFASVRDFGQLAELWAEGKPAQSGIVSNLSGSLLGKTPSARFLTAITLRPDPEAVGLVRHIAQSWVTTLSHPQQPIAVGTTVPDLKEIDVSSPQDLGYYWQPDETDPRARTDPANARHLLLVRVYPRVDYSTLSATAEPVAAIRAAVAQAAERFPEFNFGTTGQLALDADEMTTTDRDSHIAETIAAIFVFLGMWVMLRSIWLALAAEIALAVGIGWTFGWATVTLHELNLLSIVFLIALIGIGMDYLVQILTRFRTEARRQVRPSAIWARVFRHVSAPINTACLGAAAAFFVSVFTNFRGAAELGIIAGGGLLLCLLSGYTVLPALLTLIPPRLTVDIARRPTGLPPRPKGARRLILPAIWVTATIVLSPWISKAYFNPNLLELQAPNLESTRLIFKLQSWSAVVLSKDLSMLAKVRTALEPAKVVAETESVLNADDNYAWLRDHQHDLPAITWSAPAPMEPGEIPALAAKATALADRLTALPPAAAKKDHDERDKAIAALRAFSAMVVQRPPAEVTQRLSAWQTTFVNELHELLDTFSPHPLDLSKVPGELRSHLVSRDGTYALYIYPRPDMNLWDRKTLAVFVNQVNAYVATVPGHPDVTGLAPNIYFTTREVRKSFVSATTYALMVILFLVLLDLKNIRHTLLAISVLGLGLPLLIELMGMLNQSWNFANFFGLPILIGAGHEYGVFMIHRYRETLRDPRRVWRFWDVADRALLLCAYITSSSFGFFWFISEHRGLKSLGLVMALGTACIYLSAIMVLRPLLLWRLERKYEFLSPVRTFPIAPGASAQAVQEGHESPRIDANLHE